MKCHNCLREINPFLNNYRAIQITLTKRIYIHWPHCPPDADPSANFNLHERKRLRELHS